MMDCEKFDRVLMDLLYDELDDITRAGALRHAEHCQRCRELLHGFRAVREVGRLPLEDAPEGFEAGVLAMERLAQKRLPARQRLWRALTIVSGYAMRPQVAMAALLLLMIGSSLVLLQPKPGLHSSALVTERGVPRPEPETVVVPVPAAAPVPEAKEQAAPVAEELQRRARSAVRPAEPEVADTERELDLARRKAEERAYAEAMTAYNERRYLEAQTQFDAIVVAQGRNATTAELYAALATEEAQGCAAALPRFDSVAARNPNQAVGNTATWHSATCRAQLGQERRATLDLQKLLAVPEYSARAKEALNQLALTGDGSALAAKQVSRAADEAPAAASPAKAKALDAKSAETQAAERSASTQAAPGSPRVGAATGSAQKGSSAAGRAPAASRPAAPAAPTQSQR